MKKSIKFFYKKITNMFGIPVWMHVNQKLVRNSLLSWKLAHMRHFQEIVARRQFEICLKKYEASFYTYGKVSIKEGFFSSCSNSIYDSYFLIDFFVASNSFFISVSKSSFSAASEKASSVWVNLWVRLFTNPRTSLQLSFLVVSSSFFSSSYSLMNF